jgi:hypothetical protein
MLLPSLVSPSASSVSPVSPVSESVSNVLLSPAPLSAQPSARTAEQDKPKVKEARDTRDIISAAYQGLQHVVAFVRAAPPSANMYGVSIREAGRANRREHE